MGAGLSNVIKSIDGSSDAEKQIQDSMNALFALGESRNAAAWAQATSDVNKVYAPISKVLLRRQTIVASASVGNKDGVVGGIKGAVGNLMKGQILDGVTDIISSAMDVVLGASSGQVSSQYTYALIATDLGALLRIDVDIYSFELKSSGLQARAKNMTAVTSLISTVNPQNLTLSDLRGIVSLSYGGSPEDRQKAIFELVKAAWENDRKISLGGALDEEDHANFRSLIIPSEYERKYASSLGAVTVEPATPSVDRDALRTAYKKLVATNNTIMANGSSNGNTFGAVGSNGNTLGAVGDSNGVVNGTKRKIHLTPLPGVNEDTMREVFLWIMTTSGSQVTADWVAMMAGAISGFNVTGMVKYVEISGGLSGNAITFKLKVNSSQQCFDLCIKYIRDTMLGQLRKAEYLNYLISHMALQYEHPSDGHLGLITVVQYNANRITNLTDDNIDFYDETDLVLTIPPKGAATLDGPISHIIGRPQAAATNGGTAGGDSDAGDANAKPDATVKKPDTSIPVQWVTYEDQPALVHAVEGRLSSAGKNSGYVLSTNDGFNKPVTVTYTVAQNSSNPALL
ncbi:hypothetical protein AMS68_007205 [Peltaster fructicola]|uniref:Uncharacterized protein n=1 Tax=Peltaster fructicola TaxID=286661 RepID=A0A6H0Y4C0_9PEZI|nr:hypothetical protein AMS68_007205 [Peltaster fructicola]